MIDTIDLGIKAFNSQLASVNISELLIEENDSYPKIDWNEKV